MSDWQENETLRRIEADMRTMAQDIRETRETVILIKARDTEGAIKELKAEVVTLKTKIEVLENIEARRSGAKGTFEWIAKYGPTLAFIAMAISIALGVANNLAINHFGDASVTRGSK